VPGSNDCVPCHKAGGLVENLRTRQPEVHQRLSNLSGWEADPVPAQVEMPVRIKSISQLQPFFDEMTEVELLFDVDGISTWAGQGPPSNLRDC